MNLFKTLWYFLSNYSKPYPTRRFTSKIIFALNLLRFTPKCAEKKVYLKIWPNFPILILKAELIVFDFFLYYIKWTLYK